MVFLGNAVRSSKKSCSQCFEDIMGGTTRNPDDFINEVRLQRGVFPASCFSDFKHMDEVVRKYLLFPESSLTGQLTLVFGGDTCLMGRLITRADI